MIRILTLAFSLLCMAALTSAGAGSARAVGGSVPAPAGSAQIVRTSLGPVSGMQSPDLGLNVLVSALPILAGNNNQVNNNNQGNGDPPAPNPEPSTTLTFGIALLIGGGVLFLGRLRQARK